MLALLLLLPASVPLGCGAPVESDRRITGVEAQPNPMGGMYLSFHTFTDGAARVAYGPAGGPLTGLTPRGPTGRSHEVHVLGLKRDTVYEFQPIVETGAGRILGAPFLARTYLTNQQTPYLRRTRHEADRQCAAGGFVLLDAAADDQSNILLVDRAGEVVWSFFSPDVASLCDDTEEHTVFRVRPGPGPDRVSFLGGAAQRLDRCGGITSQPLSGAAPWQTIAFSSHHDFVHLPSEGFAWLGYVKEPYDECVEQGHTLPADAAADTLNESETNSYWHHREVFHTFTDHPDPLVCDVDDSGDLQDAFDLTAGNSLAYRSSDDAYFVMWGQQHSLLKIDRATGEHLWTFGGLHNDFRPATGQDPSERFGRAHLSEVWDGGMLVFDNGDPGPSSVQEYVLDEEEMTWSIAWQWALDSHEPHRGDVRRMPYADCDNLLITRSATGRVQEMTRDGEVVWEVELPEGFVVHGAHFVPDIYDMSSAAYPE